MTALPDSERGEVAHTACYTAQPYVVRVDQIQRRIVWTAMFFRGVLAAVTVTIPGGILYVLALLARQGAAPRSFVYVGGFGFVMFAVLFWLLYVVSHHYRNDTIACDQAITGLQLLEQQYRRAAYSKAGLKEFCEACRIVLTEFFSRTRRPLGQGFELPSAPGTEELIALFRLRDRGGPPQESSNDGGRT